MNKQTRIHLTRLQYGLAIAGLFFIPFDSTFRPSIILFGLSTLVSTYLFFVKDKKE